MIVPFSVIPMQYMMPLQVETKMEYNINKRRFPGINDKHGAVQPTLLIAEKPREIFPIEDAPLDFTKSSSSTASGTPSTSSAINPSRATTSRRHLSIRARRSRRPDATVCHDDQLNTTQNPTADTQDATVANEATTLRLFGVPETNRQHHDVSARATTCHMSRSMAPMQISIPENNGPARKPVSGSTTHPSYLDFIYGENGILSKAASKSNPAIPQQTVQLVHPRLQSTVTTTATPKAAKAKSTANKRKRSSEVTDSKPAISKKIKSGSETCKKVHTVHHLPSRSGEASLQKQQTNFSDVKFFNPIGRPGALAFGSYYGQIMVNSVPSRPTCGRQS